MILRDHNECVALKLTSDLYQLGPQPFLPPVSHIFWHVFILVNTLTDLSLAHVVQPPDNFHITTWVTLNLIGRDHFCANSDFLPPCRCELIWTESRLRSPPLGLTCRPTAWRDTSENSCDTQSEVKQKSCFTLWKTSGPLVLLFMAKIPSSGDKS